MTLTHQVRRRQLARPQTAPRSSSASRGSSPAAVLATPQTARYGIAVGRSSARWVLQATAAWYTTTRQPTTVPSLSGGVTAPVLPIDTAPLLHSDIPSPKTRLYVQHTATVRHEQPQRRCSQQPQQQPWPRNGDTTTKPSHVQRSQAQPSRPSGNTST